MEQVTASTVFNWQENELLKNDSENNKLNP